MVIKTCPFCGAEAVTEKLKQYEDDNGLFVFSGKWEYKISCPNNCAGTGWYKTKRTAVKYWNRRV